MSREKEMCGSFKSQPYSSFQGTCTQPISYNPVLWQPFLKEKIHSQCMGLTVVSSLILNGETDLFLPSKDMTVNMCTGKMTHLGSSRPEDLKLVCFGNTASINASSG